MRKIIKQRDGPITLVNMRTAAPPSSPTEKVCSRCKVAQPAGNFWRQTYAPDGRSSICKNCNKVSAEAARRRKKADDDLYGIV